VIWFWVIVVCLAILGGVAAAVRTVRGHPPLTPLKRTTGGYVYVLEPIEDEDPDGPERLVKICRMPADLRVVWSFYFTQPERVVAAIHSQLAEYRHHGDWYDREATLAFIDHLKGEAA